jgi:hypothetical protein
MELLSSLAVGLQYKNKVAEGVAEFVPEGRCGFKLPKAQVISALLSLMDWSSDFAYSAEVYSWTTAGHAPTAAEVQACMAFVGEHGAFANGTWTWETALQGVGAPVAAGTCVAVGADGSDGSASALLHDCSQPRVVDVPTAVLLAMYLGAAAGALGDLCKGVITFRGDAKDASIEQEEGPRKGTVNPLHDVEEVEWVAEMALEVWSRFN